MEKVLEQLDINPADPMAVKAKEQTRLYCEKLYDSLTFEELSLAANFFYDGYLIALKGK